MHAICPNHHVPNVWWPVTGHAIDAAVASTAAPNDARRPPSTLHDETSEHRGKQHVHGDLEHDPDDRNRLLRGGSSAYAISMSTNHATPTARATRPSMRSCSHSLRVGDGIGATAVRGRSSCGTRSTTSRTSSLGAVVARKRPLGPLRRGTGAQRSKPSLRNRLSTTGCSTEPRPFRFSGGSK